MFKVNAVTSNQSSVHEDLIGVASKHKKNNFKRPFAEHSMTAFESLTRLVEKFDNNIIIDACCGVGESTLALAKQHPDKLIVGIDKSAARLNKHDYYRQQLQFDGGNAVILQADLYDLWRLIAKQSSAGNWQVARQYIFYPNPYPKKSQLSKRWHASPVMPSIVIASPDIECRSNWLTYLQEMKQVLALYGIDATIEPVQSNPLTPFERKYMQSGQSCWKLNTSL